MSSIVVTLSLLAVTVAPHTDKIIKTSFLFLKNEQIIGLEKRKVKF